MSKEQKEQKPENPEGSAAVKEVQSLTGRKFLEATRVARGGEFVVAQERLDARMTEKNFLEAIDTVNSVYKGVLRIDPDDIEVKKLIGDIVGASTTTTIELDAALFRQPVWILVMVLAHELAHDNRNVMSETVVHGLVDVLFPNHGLEHGHGREVQNFRKMAKIFNPGNETDGAMQIYNLYRAGQFEDLYMAYHGKAITEAGSVEERNTAFKLFTDTFPEIRYDGNKLTGYFQMMRPEDHLKEASQMGADMMAGVPARVAKRVDATVERFQN